MDNGLCPDCKIKLIDVGAEIIPEAVKDEMVVTQKIEIPVKKQNLGGGYSDEEDSGEVIGEVIVETPSDEIAPVEEAKPKKKRKMSEETKAKIRASLKKRKANK
jgi:hypothetical protein